MTEDIRKKAVALKYDRKKDNAPKITAKGTGAIAERIIQIAMEESIPISEDPDLVAALIHLDFQEEIPPELYRAVAEILAFAYKLNRRLADQKIT